MTFGSVFDPLKAVSPPVKGNRDNTAALGGLHKREAVFKVPGTLPGPQ